MSSAKVTININSTIPVDYLFAPTKEAPFITPAGFNNIMRFIKIKEQRVLKYNNEIEGIKEMLYDTKSNILYMLTNKNEFEEQKIPYIPFCPISLIIKSVFENCELDKETIYSQQESNDFDDDKFSTPIKTKKTNESTYSELDSDSFNKCEVSGCNEKAKVGEIDGKMVCYKHCDLPVLNLEYENSDESYENINSVNPPFPNITEIAKHLDPRNGKRKCARKLFGIHITE